MAISPKYVRLCAGRWRLLVVMLVSRSLPTTIPFTTTPKIYDRIEVKWVKYIKIAFLSSGGRNVWTDECIHSKFKILQLTKSFHCYLSRSNFKKTFRVGFFQCGWFNQIDIDRPICSLGLDPDLNSHEIRLCSSLHFHTVFIQIHFNLDDNQKGIFRNGRF